MRRYFNNFSLGWVKACVALCFLLISQLLSAADISRDVREGRAEDTNGGYLEISVAGILNKMPIPRSDDKFINVGIGGHYRYKRFFIDTHAESYNQLQYGFNPYSGDIWSFDILGATSEHGVDSELNKELDLFTSRDSASYLGVRATGYSDQYIIQFEALQDISNVHRGALVTATVARQWLYKNWNFHALIGARYETSGALDHQFGISAEEVTGKYSEYQAGSGTTIVSEVGITYPLNQYFVLKTTGRWWELPSAIVNSPFITGDSYLTLSTSLTFVY